MTASRVAPQGAERFDGWRRLAIEAAKELRLDELDQVWTFPKLRHERREFGTAVFSHVQGERRRIYTGRWALVIRGAERGQFQSVIEEVGSGPLEALEAMLLEVRRRIDDAEPPEPVSVREFFGEELLAEMAFVAAPPALEASDSDAAPSPETADDLQSAPELPTDGTPQP